MSFKVDYKTNFNQYFILLFFLVRCLQCKTENFSDGKFNI